MKLRYFLLRMLTDQSTQVYPLAIKSQNPFHILEKYKSFLQDIDNTILYGISCETCKKTYDEFVEMTEKQNQSYVQITKNNSYL